MWGRKCFCKFDLSKTSASTGSGNKVLLDNPLSSSLPSSITGSSSSDESQSKSSTSTSTTASEKSKSSEESDDKGEESKDEEGTEDLDDSSFDDLGESGEVSSGNLSKIFIGMGVVGIGLSLYAVWDSRLFGKKRFSEVKEVLPRYFGILRLVCDASVPQARSC